MNQILEYGTENSGKSSRGGRGGGGSSSDKIVRFLAIFLMIFAICLIGSGAFSLFKNKKDSKPTETPTVSKINAEIDAHIDEESKKVVIDVTSEVAISKVIYTWNTTTNQMTIDGEKKTEFSKEIDLPSGTNDLNIKVVDVDGNETIDDFTFESLEGSDIISPNITLTVTDDKKLLITATDETALSFITYRWNDSEEETINAEEGQKELTKELEIPLGKNSITVVAVDASDKNNTTTETKSLVGVKKPEIHVDLVDNHKLVITVRHENGIKEIYYTLNDKPYRAVFEGDQIQPEIQFEQELDVGYNLINLDVTSVDNTVENFCGECDYNPEPSEETTENQSPNDGETNN